MNGSNLGIDGLSIGISKDGMASYRENLKLTLLTQCTQALDHWIDDLKTAISTGWQGVSRDNFFTLLDQQVQVVKEDIEKEYYDLEARLTEIEINYLNQDKYLIQ